MKRRIRDLLLVTSPIIFLAVLAIVGAWQTLNRDVIAPEPIGCEEPVVLPYVGIKGFLYCEQTGLVKSDSTWEQPGRLETKRIEEWHERTK